MLNSRIAALKLLKGIPDHIPVHAIILILFSQKKAEIYDGDSLAIDCRHHIHEFREGFLNKSQIFMKGNRHIQKPILFGRTIVEFVPGQELGYKDGFVFVAVDLVPPPEEEEPLDEAAAQRAFLLYFGAGG